MKFLKSSILLLVTMLAIGMTSCKDKTPGVQSLLPADADLLMAFDMSRTFENAGCKAGVDGITLSPTVKGLLESSGADEEVLNDIANMRGIDFANIYIVANNVYGNNPTFALLTEVLDMNALTESLNNLGLENEMEDDYMVYDADASILIRDNIVWISDKNPTKAIENIESIKSKASSKSVASVNWVSNYLASDCCMSMLLNFAGMPENVKKQINTQASVGASAVAKLMEGRLAFSVDFKGLEATLKANGMAADGKQINITEGLGDMKPTTINTDFLDYLTADDILVFAVSVPENYPWKDLLSAMAANAGVPMMQLQMVLPYLEDIQGTVAVAAGPTNGVISFNNPSSSLEFDGMICVTLKPGKAEEYFEQLSQLAGMAGTVNMDKADKSLSVDAGIATLHMAVRGDMLVISTHAITKTGASIFSKSDFAGQYSTLMVKLGKDTRLAEDLHMPFGVFSRMFTEDNTGIWNTELTDCSGLFLGNLLEYCATQCK